jgi:hypothetical protein
LKRTPENGKNSHVHELEELILQKWLAVLPKAIHRFNEISIQISMLFFKEIENIIQKVIWKTLNSQIWTKRAMLELSHYLTSN